MVGMRLRSWNRDETTSNRGISNSGFICSVWCVDFRARGLFLGEWYVSQGAFVSPVPQIFAFVGVGGRATGMNSVGELGSFSPVGVTPIILAAYLLQHQRRSQIRFRRQTLFIHFEAHIACYS